MALHGSATIELTNADGSKEVIKHDNIITNAPNDLLKGYGGDIAAICKFMKSGENFMQELFGGILLFSDVLDSDAANYFIPNGKIVGYASQDAYAGLDTARGSYNASESGAQNDGSYRFVWDFSTAQGNGTIKALALCPNRMGQIGASATIVNSEKKQFSQNNPMYPFNINGYMLSNTQGQTTAGVSNYNFIAVAILDDIVYAINIENINTSNSNFIKTSGVLRLYRFQIGETKVGASACLGSAAYIDSIDVQLPSTFLSVISTRVSRSSPAVVFSFISSTGELVIVPGRNSVAVNGTLPYIGINLKNGMNVTSYTFTNNTGGNILSSCSTQSIGFLNGLWVGVNEVVAVANIDSVYKLYSIKRSNNTDVKELKFMDGSAFEFNSSYALQPLFQTSGVMVVYSYDSSHPSDNGVLFLDLANGIVHKTNALSLYGMHCNVDCGNGVLYLETGDYLTCLTVVNPFVLCTKNNLDTAVTKTASQTMKITYTLTESEKS